jgi:hypothetical protein
MKPKSITFSGVESGDGECFCWGNVSESDMKKVLGEEGYAIEVEDEQEMAEEFNREPRTPNRLWPNQVFNALGLDPTKRYKFTIMIEEEL